MTATVADVKKQIRDLGLRVTAPRLAVLRAMLAADRPLSHAEVVERVGGDEAPWDPATVYRNLVALVEAGLLRVASQSHGVTRYEVIKGDADHGHPHFVCEGCGIVSCLPSTEFELPRIAKWNRALKTAKVQLVGHCPKCTAGS